MKLNYREFGKGKPLMILHGIFGSSDNWQTVGKHLSEKFRVFLVDLRNHGNSPHDEQFNYESMVDDIVELLNDLQLPRTCLMGHSMGGKVAMELAASYPEKVEKLIVVDIAPKYYPPHHQEIFAGFHSVQLNQITSRKEADDQLSTVIKNPGVRQFLLKNLTRDGQNEFKWKLNLESIERNIENVGSGLTEGSIFNGPTLFLNGSASDYITSEDHPLILKHFPQANMVKIEGAGHWIHADKPQELLREVEAFLS